MTETPNPGRAAPRAGGILRTIARFSRSRRGVAAVEFAFIVPILLTLYFVTMEVAQAIQTNKKVGRVSSMVADLITQQATMAPSQIDAIMKIGESILQPYNRSRPKIVVTAIQIDEDEDPEVQIAWSRQLENGTYSRPFPEGNKVDVPAKLDKDGSFLIRVEAYLNYEPVITWTTEQKTSLGLLGAFDGISMHETYYLRPRMSTDISCDDC